MKIDIGSGGLSETRELNRRPIATALPIKPI
jgi:hypothetical protein